MMRRSDPGIKAVPFFCAPPQGPVHRNLSGFPVSSVHLAGAREAGRESDRVQTEGCNVVVWVQLGGAAGFGGSEALHLGDWEELAPPSLPASPVGHS